MARGLNLLLELLLVRGGACPAISPLLGHASVSLHGCSPFGQCGSWGVQHVIGCATPCCISAKVLIPGGQLPHQALLLLQLQCGLLPLLPPTCCHAHGLGWPLVGWWARGSS